MKKITLLLISCYATASLIAQTTGRLENLKDAWGTSYNYVGEIRNKQPNGLGVAIYSNGKALRYAGNFMNGQFNGKGALVFNDGSFLSGDWKNGKLNGRGANLNSDGDLYVGGFVDGKKEGTGSYVYNDKSLLVGNLKNDTYEGRCIFINAAGTTVADNIYSAGKKNGSGYQYELDSKKLYEGTWSNGDWVSAGTAAFNSFLKSNKFYAEKTNDQILIGGIDSANKLQDTSFFYDLKNLSRYFGYNENGYLTDGIIVRDSTTFLGKSNETGAYGNCSLYKLKKYYDEGNYADDYLNGNNSLSINLEKKTIYFGSAKSGYFTGKAWFVNNFNEVHNGSFENGKFTGSGFIVFNTGKTVKGVFDDGYPVTITSFTDENGAPIDMKPKSFESALSLVAGELLNDLVVFKGREDSTLYDDYYTAEKSIISFPGSVGSNYVFEDDEYHIGYRADFYQGKNFQAAKAQYEKLCKDIASSNIHIKGSDFKPAGTAETPIESETTRTKFSLDAPGLSSYHIYAELKYKGGEYTASLIAGDVVYDK